MVKKQDYRPQSVRDDDGRWWPVSIGMQAFLLVAIGVGLALRPVVWLWHVLRR